MVLKSVCFVFIVFCLGLLSCKKNSSPGAAPPGTQDPRLDYGDSVFYLAGNNADYIIHPAQPAAGKYYGFPDGADLDENSGAINITKSETGLRYRISFVPDGKSDSISTMIVISGINFLDGFYKLDGDDSVAYPVYNGRLTNPVPGVHNGSVFDEGSNCNSKGCTVNTDNGQINLAETVRNGVFGSTPSNNARKEFEMDYRINDKSGKAANVIRVKLYYFDSMADVTQEAYDIISAREGTIFGLTFHGSLQQRTVEVNAAGFINQLTSSTTLRHPRPPCIFIVKR